jgi:hypothetical protein
VSKFSFLTKKETPAAEARPAKGEGKQTRAANKKGAARKSAAETGTGKRNSKDYVQLLAYIKKDTRTRLDIAIIKEKARGNKIEISSLVDELINGWLKSQKG